LHKSQPWYTAHEIRGQIEPASNQIEPASNM
jgi:hypothetical protein